jgi:cyclohexanone monooxygenase
MTAGFPNMFFTNGPGSCTGFFNPVMLVEYQGEWIATLLERMRVSGLTSVESEPEADEKWVTHMREVAAPTLFWNSNNWYIGANVPGKLRVMLLYLGGFANYRQMTTAMEERNYEGFRFSCSGRPVALAG